ncbi:NAD(+)/NADH kinase, partial [Aliarcobacter butzleri]
MIDSDGLEFDDICKKEDFLISVGGDGTLLGVVRKSFKYNLPILGIILVTSGFLTHISMTQLENFIVDLKKE